MENTVIDKQEKWFYMSAWHVKVIKLYYLWITVDLLDAGCTCRSLLQYRRAGVGKDFEKNYGV